MKLPYAWRFALGTCWCVTALWGCAEGTLQREDDVQSRDNPFPQTQLTFTRGSTGDGQLPPLSHTLHRFALDAGPGDDATPVDAAGLPDAAGDAAPGAGHGNH